MKVTYLTMQFPAPSEAFAAPEIKALQRLGIDLSVHTLRPEPRLARNQLRQRGLADLVVSHNSLSASARGMLIGLRRPRLLLDLLAFIVRYTRFKVGHLVKGLLLVPRSLEIFDRVEREPPDVVHLFWGHYPSLAGYLIYRHGKFAVLSVFLGAYDLVEGYGGSRALAPLADVVWTHAQANLPAIHKLGVPREKTQVCYRGIEIGALPPAAAAKIRDRVIVAGRLVPGKRVDEALRAFTEVLRRRPGATLVVMGGGPKGKRLAEFAKHLGLEDSVSFIGHVSQQEVFEQMDRAEVLLSMSQSPTERLPNVVKEAMLRRCVCVVGRTIGINELIPNGRHGAIVPAGDFEAAAVQVVRILDDDGLRGEIAATAFRHVVERFDVDKLMPRYISKWRDVVAAKRRGRSAGAPCLERVVLRGCVR